MEQVDCVVIGAGIVGLAAARALALAGHEVIVVDEADTIGTQTSSRNSEVIHAGIYYPEGSNKAVLCVRGKKSLYEYCEERQVPYQRCGKLIVATSTAQVGELRRIQDKAKRNGVADLEWLSESRAAEREPAVRCVAALSSPSTGIVDSHGLMMALRGDAETAGALFAFHSRVTGGAVLEKGIRVDVGDHEPMSLLARLVVNSAGLHADRVAHSIRGIPSETIPRHYYAKGNYFCLSGRAPFNRLIYPVPEQAGLGVHLTLDMGGQARFGPDVEWIDELDYSVDPRRAEVFYDAIRRYWPDLPDGSLQPGYAGIRPKTRPRGQPAGDFLIHGPAHHGIEGLVNLYGIESPGLTSSLAIADEVCRLVSS